MQAAVAANNASLGGNTITFKCDKKEGDIPISEPLSISKSLTIDGDKQITLNGHNEVQVFQVKDAAALVLKELTVANGLADGVAPNSTNGGGLDDESSSTVTLREITFANNSAPGGTGGAVYHGSSGTMSISNCTFTGNQATTGGGLDNDFGIANSL